MQKNYKPFPVWGPYSKKYAGISKIVSHREIPGARFDFSVAPAVSAFDIKVPNVTLPSACHPWQCSSDYGFYSFRHEIEWKDAVYADVSYTRLDENSTLVRTEIFNNTEVIKNCVVNYFASLEFPAYSYTKADFPKKCDVIKATEYTRYDYAIKRPWDEQNADGRRKGEFSDSRFTCGKGLGDRCEKWHMPHRIFKPFGGEKGDSVLFHAKLERSYENACLAVRYRTSDIKYVQGKMVGVTYINSKNTARFTANGKELVLPPCDEPDIVFLPLGKLEKGDFELELISIGTGAAEFDFFAVCEQREYQKISVHSVPVDFTPDISREESESGILTHLIYKGIDDDFYLRVFDSNTRSRKIETGSLEDCMTARLSNADETFDDLTESFTGAFKRKHSDDGFFHNEISHTIFVKPHTSQKRYAVISNGKCAYLTESEYEKKYEEAKQTAIEIKLNEAGQKYAFSNQLLAAAVMTNVVYPIYKYNDYIIHHTPGKRWDCLYTWDSGFIGLAMNEYAPHFARYILDTYLSNESNPDYAFLHHGSPVPVQIYQLFEMLQKSNDKQSNLEFYNRARLYYLFLCGKIRGSTTAKFKSGLLTTYDYFYSSSGMDDYPAQVKMMHDELRDKAAPVITTSQVIRFAKLLKIIADKTGRADDVKEYDKDITRLTDALDKYSWDSESGYYSYVLHDESYAPTKRYTTENGENVNKGLDGIYPIIAGACSKTQRKAVLSHLKDETEMLSPYGISAVDQSASYYKINGYWNGNIWFPHQWFIWKAMLDCFEGDFAFEIAKRAIDIWKREVESTYYTFEMVNVKTGCGGWFHNFGGLSTPINLWTKAYFSPGTVNVGFDTYLDRTVFCENNSRLEVDFTYYGENSGFLMLAVMNGGKKYEAKLDGKKINVNERVNGLAELEIKCGKGSHKIEVWASPAGRV